MRKRKVSHDAAKTNNNTPTESMPDGPVDFGAEEPIKGANRNSKRGRQGE